MRDIKKHFAAKPFPPSDIFYLFSSPEDSKQKSELRKTLFNPIIPGLFGTFVPRAMVTW